MKKIKHFIKTRRILSVTIAIIVLILGYWIYSKYTSSTGTNTYIFAKAQIKDVVSSITGTGQIYASSQLDIKSKVSGDIVYLNTKANGTQITKGTLIAQIDSTDAQIDLENARISYEKTIKKADAPTLLQSQTALNTAILNNKKSYDEGLNSITDTLVGLPTIMNGINNIIYDNSGYLLESNIRVLGQTALDYKNTAGAVFDKSKNSYNSLLIKYKDISRNSSTSTIESYVSDTYQTVKYISDALKSLQNAVEYVRSIKNDSSGNTTANNIATWTNTINSDLSNLLSSKNNITSTYTDIAQKNADLIKVQTGADELDIESQLLSLRQKENNYQNYFIRAPFDGLLARLSVKATDSVSSGTIIGTLVSSQKISIITLNEVDVAKVKVGQKAKLKFDAIDGLVMDGTVTTVDLVGTVSQGVVNYNVEITLDNQDERIKSGMSVSAEIIIDTKNSVLTVPNSAIKNQGKNQYVELFAGSSTTPPIQKKVITGISNDNITEIVQGLNVGDQVVVRTISGTIAKTTTSLFGGNTGASRNTTAGSATRALRN